MDRVAKAAELYPFLIENLHLSPAEFILKYKSGLGDDIQFAAAQLNGLKRAKKKLPLWFKNNAILYPPNLNIEQSSSELTANYKRQFFKGLKSTVDLTGGFAVDSWAIAQEVEKHTYVEPNAELLEIVKSNFTALKIQNSDFNIQNAEDWLAKNRKVDAIYIDPSRRVEGQKKFKLSECVPDVVSLQYDLLNTASKVLIKLSPLADLQAIINAISSISKIHIVAFKNEVKEVLVLLEKDVRGETPVHCINFLDNKEPQGFAFKLSDEKAAQTQFAAVGKYLYEPNAAILKAGAFKLVGERYGLSKLHTNTHLYTSDKANLSFPGRVFELIEERPKSVNIISRNHPLKPQQLAKKYKVKEGAVDDYLIAFRDNEKPKVTFCKCL